MDIGEEMTVVRLQDEVGKTFANKGVNLLEVPDALKGRVHFRAIGTGPQRAVLWAHIQVPGWTMALTSCKRGLMGWSRPTGGNQQRRWEYYVKTGSTRPLLQEAEVHELVERSNSMLHGFLRAVSIQSDAGSGSGSAPPTPAAEGRPAPGLFTAASPSPDSSPAAACAQASDEDGSAAAAAAAVAGDRGASSAVPATAVALAPLPPTPSAGPSNRVEEAVASAPAASQAASSSKPSSTADTATSPPGSPSDNSPNIHGNDSETAGAQAPPSATAAALATVDKAAVGGPAGDAAVAAAPVVPAAALLADIDEEAADDSDGEASGPASPASVASSASATDSSSPTTRLPSPTPAEVQVAVRGILDFNARLPKGRQRLSSVEVTERLAIGHPLMARRPTELRSVMKSMRLSKSKVEIVLDHRRLMMKNHKSRAASAAGRGRGGGAEP